MPSTAQSTSSGVQAKTQYPQYVLPSMLSHLSDGHIQHLWSRLLENHNLSSNISDRDTMITLMADVRHIDMVLLLADDPSEIGMDCMEALLGRSIYLAARGETGEPLTDIRGRRLKTPLGHRRGEPPPSMYNTQIKRRMRRAPNRADNRVIVHITPNPKDPSRSAYHRYAQYRLGATLDEMVRDTDITRADVRWDLQVGYIIAVSPQYAEEELRKRHTTEISTEWLKKQMWYDRNYHGEF